MRLRTSSYLILGMLRANVSTGYAIKRAVDQSTRFFWAASFAQVYPELARLAEHGYIAGRDEPRGARTRKTYRITPKGERALDTWLRSERVQPFEFRDEGLLRLFFADALPPEEALALVRRLHRQARELDDTFRKTILPIAQSVPDQGLRFPLDTARLGADYYSWRAKWFARLEAELEAISAVGSPSAAR